jgi:hypothetical protein
MNKDENYLFWSVSWQNPGDKIYFSIYNSGGNIGFAGRIG